MIDNCLRNFIARGSVDLRHKSRAYCVSNDNSTALVPVFWSVPRDFHKTLVSGLHLFQTYAGVWDDEASGTIHTLRS